MDEPAQLTGKQHSNLGMKPPEDNFKSADGLAQLRRFALAAGLLVLCFAVPLWQLIRFTANSEFHSFILLIPFISLYLVWLKRPGLPASAPPARAAGVAFLLAGLATMAVYWIVLRSRLRQAEDEYLAVMMAAFLLLFFGICRLFFGRDTVRAVAFPLGLLIFMAPIPALVMPSIDSFLQKGSAIAAAGFFQVSGTPFFQDGLVFQLPDIRLEIAPECSGIQSSMVLLITSLVGGYVFLRTPWKRALLTLFVIPLCLLRNGFRVFVIGQLCVHWGPQMINSPIHHKGGPIFFVLSLIPLFILLIALHKTEKGNAKTDLKTSKTNHE